MSVTRPSPSPADGPATGPGTLRDVLGEVFDAVLFDMDGTLISSTAAVERCWRTLAVECGVPVERVSPFPFHGVLARDIIDDLLAGRPAQERAAALNRVVELEVSDTAGIAVLPGSAQALEVLVEAGRCAVVTSCGRRLADARLGSVDLLRPAVLVTADDVTHGKPDPEPYRVGADRLAVDVRRCLVVEDAASGVRSGRAAGAATLALRTTDPAGPDGDLVVSDLGAVRFTATAQGVRVRVR